MILSGHKGLLIDTHPPFSRSLSKITPPQSLDKMSRLTRFVNNGSGLEKTLRLIQSLAQIAAVFTVGSTAVRFTTAKLQLALSKYTIALLKMVK